MDHRLRDYYLESQVNNATPGQVLVMLYDCLIEHAEGADRELGASESPLHFGAAAREVAWCIKVLTELTTSLRHGENPELCAQLCGLYEFFTRELYAALERRESGRVRGILPLLRRLRDSWANADRLAGQYKTSSVAIAA